MVHNFNIQKVLIAPLDWGLGHATRCIPIIRALRDLNYQIIVAASGKTKHLLQQEFPHVQFVELSGYNVYYSKNKAWLPLVLLLQIPKIVKAILAEQKWLRSFIQQEEIDLIISDNRYGLYSKTKPSIFITHQLLIKAPHVWVEKILQKLNYRLIQRFTACWVPDFAAEKNIAGVLSHPKSLPKIPVHYLGVLSRFSKAEHASQKFEYCFLLSGPEPQRSLLEYSIVKDLHLLNEPSILIRGLPGIAEELTHPIPSHIEVYNHLSESTLQQIIASSRIIICRSGYTTVMELLAMQQKALLIPTPGQTEQEYLAARLMQQNWCISIAQKDFVLLSSLHQAKAFQYVIPEFDDQSLTHKLQSLLCKYQMS